jgi:rare lipoprotein A
MQSKAIVTCAFAAAILATTADIASARSHYLRHHTYRTAHSQGGEPTAHAGASYSGAYSGIASVYSGGRTANGEYASAGALTAAHRTLPFGTMVRVTNNSTGRSVVVRINDRGPFVRGRVIDLTPAGARALGFSGLAPVTLAVEGRSS